MSSEVRRYDAVHIRYEDNNIRYGEGCEVEVVTAADYEREVRIAIAAGQRMQDERDALHAEAEALRAECERLAGDLRRQGERLVESMHEKQRLRRQRDKLAGLLERARGAIDAMGWDDLETDIDAALAEIKP